MKLDEALNLLRQVCAGYRGTLQEHQALQEALKTVSDKCTETGVQSTPVGSEKEASKKEEEKADS